MTNRLTSNPVEYSPSALIDSIPNRLSRMQAEYRLVDSENVRSFNITVDTRTLLEELEWCHEILKEYPAPSDRTDEQKEELMFKLIEIAENSNNILN